MIQVRVTSATGRFAAEYPGQHATVTVGQVLTIAELANILGYHAYSLILYLDSSVYLGSSAKTTLDSDELAQLLGVPHKTFDGPGRLVAQVINADYSGI